MATGREGLPAGASSWTGSECGLTAGQGWGRPSRVFRRQVPWGPRTPSGGRCPQDLGPLCPGGPEDRLPLGTTGSLAGVTHMAMAPRGQRAGSPLIQGFSLPAGEPGGRAACSPWAPRGHSRGFPDLSVQNGPGSPLSLDGGLGGPPALPGAQAGPPRSWWACPDSVSALPSPGFPGHPAAGSLLSSFSIPFT